jgi:UBX domain-containing protein 1
LYDTADPRNAEILNTIRSGRAPLHIMNVRQDQEVDVKVEPHDGPYVAPKKKYKPFSGSGQRLGSPVPGVSSSSAPAPAPAAASRSTGASSSSGPSQPTVDVDSSQPTVSLQIRLGDGSRLGSRFNTTHTIGDVYGFVSSASPQSQGRSWVLMTTFPNKDQTDKTATLADTPELKKGGVLVQKWT